MRKEKTAEYLELISQKIAELFQDETISMDEIENEDNLTDFMHALGNVFPCHFYISVTGKKVNTLEFNHIMNKLVFQGMKDDLRKTDKDEN